MTFLLERYHAIQQQCPTSTLVVVTKKQDATTSQQAIDAGVTDIGEAKVQDALQKKSQLSGSFRYHLIGHLQSNKVKDAVKIFDMIQSVDSLKLIDALQKEAKKNNKKLPILLQVNLTHEQQKYGFLLSTIDKAIIYASQQSHLDLQGCMCMGKQGDAGVTHMVFGWLQHICIKHDLPICSMGMSHDRKIAHEEGSTMLRIGSILFE